MTAPRAPTPPRPEQAEERSGVTAAFRPDAPEPESVPIVPIATARGRKIALVVALALAFVAAAYVAAPLLAGLLLGVLTAFVLEPLHRKLLLRMPGRRSLTAFITVFAFGLAATGVGVFLAWLVGRELVGVASVMQNELGALADSRIGQAFVRSMGDLGIGRDALRDRLIGISEKVAGAASATVGGVLGSVFHWASGALIALVTAFYTLRDRRPIEHRLAELLPLDPSATRELMGEFRKVGRETLIGSVIAGAIQGALSTIGYALGGVPRPALFGILTALASFIPVLGTLLVWVPVSIVLIASGRVAAGAFELVWGVVVTAGLVDYVIRPMVCGREGRSHPLLFLVGLIGGVEVMGGVGLVAGPIVMAFFASALRIYRREIVEPAQRTPL